ncbi:MAG TPA: RraA family protein [Bryobacteraceae bacterium]|nr:RraA family protein [Bryobacteraceae bacterium]
MPLSDADLKLLAQYDTPTISNVIELFAVRPRNAGYMDGRIRACFPEMPPIVGYASTATMRTAYARAEGDVYGSLDEQLARFAELPGPAIVVFQDLDDPAVGATFGEVMCTSYQSFGAVGIITSGPARDLDQVRRRGFAAFSNGVVASHSYSHTTSIHQPVRVGGLEVRAGDLLHADANGVCGIPLGIAAEVAQVAEEFVAAEACVMQFADSGSRDLAGYSAARREMMRRIEELSRRVRTRAAGV